MKFDKSKEFTLTPFLIGHKNELNYQFNAIATFSNQTISEDVIEIQQSLIPIIDEKNYMWDSSDDIPLIHLKNDSIQKNQPIFKESEVLTKEEKKD